MNKKIYYSMMVVILGMFLMMAYSSYQTFYPFKILVLNEPTTMVKKIYHPGEPLTWNVDVTHYTEGVKATVTREIIGKDIEGNDVVMSLPSTNFITKKGTSKFIQNSFILSVSTPAGRYKIVIDGVYAINPNRNIYFHDETNEFLVTK